MPKIIKNHEVVDDQWQLLPADATLEQALSSNQPIVPNVLWQAHKNELSALSQLGIWLDTDELVEDIAADLASFALVALNFPVFTDGRQFSNARLLRERYSFTGEVRAVGDVLRDQLLMMKRCGFDAFAVRSDRDPHDALQALEEFSVYYQAAWDNPLPLYRRRSTETTQPG